MRGNPTGPLGPEHRRLERGASTGGLLITGAVLFGLYTLWSFLPIWTTPGRVASALEGSIATLSHYVSDEKLLDRTLSVVGDTDVELYEEDIWIERWEDTGERGVALGFEVPITVSWLGQREIWKEVEIEHVWQVDEAAESQRVATNEARSRHQAMQAARSQANTKAFWRDVSDECRKSTRDVTVTHVKIDYDDGRMDLVDCSTAFHNDKNYNGE